jgi:hypothetical protein
VDVLITDGGMPSEVREVAVERLSDVIIASGE